MRRYYGGLLREVPALVWKEGNRVYATGAFLLVVLTLFNHQVGEAVSDAWGGVSPWWAALPIALLVMYGLARANYNHLKPLSEAATMAQLGQDPLQQGLGNLWMTGQRHLRRLRHLPDGASVDPILNDVGAWGVHIAEMFERNAPELQDQFVDVLAIPIGAAGDEPVTREKLIAAVEGALERLRDLRVKHYGGDPLLGEPSDT